MLLHKLRIMNPSKSEMNSESMAAAKQGLDVVELSGLQSFAVLLPVPFDKSGEPVGSSLHALPSCPTYNRFAEPLSGLEARVTENLLIESGNIRNADARAVWEAMLNSSNRHWTSLAALFNAQQRINTNTYGMTPAASWDLVSKACCQVFRSLRVLPSRAQDMVGSSFTPKERFVWAFWTCLTAHRLLDEFVSVGWTGHPSMSGITGEYMLRNRVHPADLKRVADKQTTTQTQLTALDKDVDSVERDVDQCLQKVGLTAKQAKRQRDCRPVLRFVRLRRVGAFLPSQHLLIDCRRHRSTLLLPA